MIQEAYGDAGLGLHRGHQPAQGVLDEVLTISHDEPRVPDGGASLALSASAGWLLERLDLLATPSRMRLSPTRGP